MWLYVEKKIAIQYIGEDDTRVLTIDWKKDIKKWDIFETTEKESEQLLRIYGHLYKVSDEKVEDDTDKKTTKTEETKDIEDTEDKDETEDKEDDTEEEKSEEDLLLEQLRKTYKEKYNQEVPVNKKNDINWIKSKL